MPIPRHERIDQITDNIKNRKLIWFGTRGADALALFDIPQFSEIFSIIAPLPSAPLPENCLETLKHVRVDLEVYSIDSDFTPEALNLRRKLATILRTPSVVVTYRPGKFFASIYYPRIDTVEYLGLFHEMQAPFEHKPWVESELKKLGVNVIPWKYIGTYEEPELDCTTKWPSILRTNRSDGGAGLTLVNSLDHLKEIWSNHTDCFAGIAPYLSPNIPLNVNACVFADGSVTLHTPSLQLIGVNDLTNRFFGYCGNDFAAIKDLDSPILDELENIVKIVGKWLATMGYRGAFGLDALFYDGKVYLTEINPRFQGSSQLSSQIDKSMGYSDIFLEHIASHLGLPPSISLPLKQLARDQLNISQVIIHNCNSNPVRYNGKELRNLHYDLLPDPLVKVLPDAVTCKLIFDNAVTREGKTLTPNTLSSITYLKESFK
jgi:hypothetical protein